MTLTADLCARALIAAAISFGEEPATLGAIHPQRRRKVLAAAAFGLHHATQREIGDTARILGITSRVVFTYQNNGGQRFYKAAEQAEIAGTHHLRSNAPPPTAPRQCAEPLYATPRSRLRARAKAAEEAWKKTLPKPVKTRRAPRGAKVATLDNGVTVIRLKPVTASVAKHAAQQIAKGAGVDDLAELFDVDADSLTRAVRALEAA